MQSDKIRTGVPGWVVALVAIACLFWGAVGGVVLAVLSDDIIEDVEPFPVEASELLLTVGPGGKLEVFEAQPGDCFQAVIDTEESRVTDVDDRVPCDALHRAEVFAGFEAPAGPASYDGEEVDFFGFDGCLLFFHDYFGQPYDESDLAVSPAIPSAAAWANGRRTITCLAHNGDGEPISRPLKFSR